MPQRTFRIGVVGTLGNAPDDGSGERRGPAKYKHLLEFKRRVTPACVSVNCSPTYGRYEPWNERTN
jgi:hypothetical protein